MAEVHVTVDPTNTTIKFHNPSNQAGTHPLPVGAGQVVTVNTTAKTVVGDLGRGLGIGSLVIVNPA